MITPLLLAITVIAFGIYIYKFPPTKPTDTSKNSICLDYSAEPMNQLSVPLVHEMVNGYKNNQLAKINSSLNMDDAHSIRFELETLKAFIYHTEMNAKKHKISSKDLGLRIYYSRYPEKETWKRPYTDLSDFLGNSTTEKYEKLHTLVMIPTIRRGETDFDFNPLDEKTYTTSLKKNEAYLNNGSQTRTAALGGGRNSGGSSNSIGSQNHGGLIPPVDGGGEGF
ncbi:hypothetical protein H0I31_12130 [Tenacibaculum sp. AHE15PA]|uniref:hypothetical protein n=1 Tax=Tenacibaculum TaxID=104267 RepID=UPI001C4F68F8|nr:MULTISPECIES: hypothetical protein [Tenacibaculum]QXP73721.1 hypothetical protein H0I30_00850 [Tenacibaculum sp. AHE14PA]QXP75912.1 hypothetical protein H0I31_12130 [Tenacibaculum sp. AHE15PA]